MSGILPIRARMLFEIYKNGEQNSISLMELLKNDYGSEKYFKLKEFEDALLTFEANGLIENSKVELLEENLKYFYKITDDGRLMVEKYLKK